MVWGGCESVGLAKVQLTNLFMSSGICQSLTQFLFRFVKLKNIQVVTSCTWTLQVVRARRVMLELGGDQNFSTSVAFVHLFYRFAQL